MRTPVRGLSSAGNLIGAAVVQYFPCVTIISCSQCHRLEDARLVSISRANMQSSSIPFSRLNCTLLADSGLESVVPQ